jgi:HEAT repeat protein
MVLRTAIVKAMGVGREAGSVPDLLRVARETDDPELRREALRSLGLVGTVDAVQELVNLLQGGSPEDRLTAATALQGVGRREAGPLLVKALESSTEDLVRGYLLHGIGQSKDPASLPSVMKIVGDREQGEGVRAQAARAAGNIGDASAAPALLDLLDATPRDQRALRAAAIGSLGRLHDAATRPRLQRLLDATPANTTEWFLLKQAVDGVVPGDLRAQALRDPR